MTDADMAKFEDAGQKPDPKPSDAKQLEMKLAAGFHAEMPFVTQARLTQSMDGDGNIHVVSHVVTFLDDSVFDVLSERALFGGTPDSRAETSLDEELVRWEDEGGLPR